MRDFLPIDQTEAAAQLVQAQGGRGALAPQVALGGASLNFGREPVAAAFKTALTGRLNVRGKRSLVWSAPKGGYGPGRGGEQAGADVNDRDGAGGFGSGEAVASVAPDETELDLNLIAQLVEPAQARAVGCGLQHAAYRLMRSGKSLSAILREIDAEIDRSGLGSALGLPDSGQLARPRPLEFAAALNRLRGAQFSISASSQRTLVGGAGAAVEDDWNK
mmetsp:Transcript_27643/g.63580  ORF Transcript_27643/g.63580 Transcript_27643/m.63580 type:complete len:219 (-) Transcript_27643:270-926(-)